MLLLNALDAPIYRYEASGGMIDISFGISYALIYGGFWIITYVYYISFPDLKMICRLMNLNSVLVARPKSKSH